MTRGLSDSSLNRKRVLFLNAADAESTYASNVFYQLTHPIFQYEASFLTVSSENCDLSLSSYDLLILQGAHKEFISDQIINFVHNGGALLISLSKQTAKSYQKIMDAFEVRYDSELLSQNDLIKKWIMTTKFTISSANQDMSFKTISIDSSGFLSSDRGLFLLEHENKGVVFSMSYGQGNVSILSDEKILFPTYIGSQDNYKLGLYLIASLLKKELQAEDYEQGESLLFQPLKVEEEKQTTENFIFDCRPYTSLFGSLADSITESPYTDREKFIFTSALTFDEFPMALREYIRTFKNYGNKEGYILLKGLNPDQNLIQTPSDPAQIPDKSTFRSEFYLSSVGSCLGDVFTFIQEKGGNFFHNIFPTPHNKTNISSESSEIFLDFHTEIAFHPVNTDYLMLYCLRSDHQKTAKTMLFNIQDILPQMPRKYFDTLFENVFRTGIDYSFGSQNGKKANGPVVPILTGDRRCPYFKCDFDLMIGLTPLAQDALSYVKEASVYARKGVLLEPGDLIIIDNNRVMHGRSQFCAQYDGYDRWIQRVLVSRDLSRYKQDLHIENRTVTLQFAA